jgi:hypothetical protein
VKFLLRACLIAQPFQMIDPVQGNVFCGKSAWRFTVDFTAYPTRQAKATTLTYGSVVQTGVLLCKSLPVCKAHF